MEASMLPLNFDKYAQTYFKHVVLKYSCSKILKNHIIQH
jgi:hypothetical protein